MKTILVMVWANITSKKLQSIALGMVFIAVSILFFLSVNLFGAVGDYEDLYSESKASQGLLYVTSDASKDVVVDYLESDYGVEHVEVLSNFNNIIETNIKHDDELIMIPDAMLTEIATGIYDQLRVIEGKLPSELENNEVIFSYGKSKLNNTEIGDTVIINTNDGIKEFIIAGIAVDLTYNFDTITLNRFWANIDTVQSLESDIKEYSIGITYNEYTSSNEQEILDGLDLALGESGSDLLVIPFSLILQANSFFQIIMGAIFTLIGVILIVVGLFIIRSIIFNNIVTESKKIATLKSTGFSSFNIISMYLFEYGVIAIVSIIIGIFGSDLLSDVVLGDINDLSNLFGLTNTINIGFTIVVVIVILFIIEITVYMVAKGVSKINPAVALRRGEQINETKAVFLLPKHNKMPISLVLAIKDILYNKKMFITLVLFILATTFTIVTLSSATFSLTSQKENNQLWLGYDIDAKIVPSEQLNLESYQEIITKLETSDYVLDTVAIYNDLNSQIFDDYNNKYISSISQIFITDSIDNLDFNATHGRIAENENEIMLGYNLLDSLNKEIGDYVTVRTLGVEKEVLIVGVCQSMTNQGMTFRLFYDEMNETLIKGSAIQVNFKDASEEELELEIESIFGEDVKLVFEYANASMLSMFDVLSLVTSGVISIFSVICLVVLLNLNITNVNKERFNYGIYKSMGMSDQTIINVYLFKNSIINIVGVIVGAIFSIFLIPTIMNAITSTLGLNVFPTTIHYTSILLATGIVFAVTLINAVIIKRNISKITPKELLVE